MWSTFYWNNHLHTAQYERCCRRLDWRTLHNVLLELIPSTRSFPSNLTVYCRLWPGQAKAWRCWHPTVRNQSTKASRTFTISPAALQQLPPACTQLNIRMRRRAGSPTPRITWQLLLPPRSHRSDHDQTRSRRKQTRWATVQALCFCCWAFLYWVAWPFRPFLNTWWSRYRAGMVLFRRHSTADTSRLMRRLGKTSTTGEYQIYNSKSSCLLHNFCTVWSTHELYLVVAAKLNAEWQLALYSRLLSPKYCSYKPFTILTLEFWLFCGGRPQHPFSILRVKTRELLLLRHCVDKLFSVQVCGECQWPKNRSSGSVASKFQNNTNCDCRFCSF